MSDKHLLRKTRLKTVINVSSKKQESDVIKALKGVVERVNKDYPVELIHYSCWYLKDIVKELRKSFPAIEFNYYFNSSSVRLRLKEGLDAQARGNAIERLGKNVIGFRTALSSESIFPFVCFGYGCDFEPSSSILDRVVTIAMFGKLNKIYLHNEGDVVKFNRGSFYFRKRKWPVTGMAGIMYEIAESSILYYFSKYGKKSFINENKKSE